ncbi:acetamidase [Haladaptatus sp. R4]|uniref:acetamidase/formamidase family protein n=1 Tax=Haladaptatus sp. R4 TaxID=1679489 RepID=UPI0007B4D0B5|nr:acetamidase/formamidase family protein [Haladaptatus sp. R4]KZN26295.1 acetamidase [Haladaptatus sp. R4]
MSSTPTPDHRISAQDEHVHTSWSRDHEPIRTVESGDVVRFECRDATNGRLDADSTVEDVSALVGTLPGHPLTGPVAVEGAKPGDVLAVELLSFEHEGIGFTYCYGGDEGTGLLPEDFDEPGLHVWELEGDVGHFVDGIEVPLAPFPGNLGVAPADDGEHSTVPPRRVGGNLDVKHLTAGSTLYLPVEVDGALFSIGDCHGAQGDGEVCITGIEAPMSVTTRLRVVSGMDIEQPQFETDAFAATRGERAYGTTGISDDLMDASKKAIRHMITHLHENHGLSRTDAYLLCSATVDLKINEVVDAPNWVVSAYLPQSIFPENDTK